MRNWLSSSMTTFPRFKDFRLLLKVAVNGTHQCDSHNFSRSFILYLAVLSVSLVADYGCEAVTALLQNANQVRLFLFGLTF